MTGHSPSPDQMNKMSVYLKGLDKRLSVPKLTSIYGSRTSIKKMQDSQQSLAKVRAQLTIQKPATVIKSSSIEKLFPTEPRSPMV